MVILGRVWWPWNVRTERQLSVGWGSDLAGFWRTAAVRGGNAVECGRSGVAGGLQDAAEGGPVHNRIRSEVRDGDAVLSSGCVDFGGLSSLSANLRSLGGGQFEAFRWERILSMAPGRKLRRKTQRDPVRRKHFHCRPIARKLGRGGNSHQQQQGRKQA